MNESDKKAVEAAKNRNSNGNGHHQQPQQPQQSNPNGLSQMAKSVADKVQPQFNTLVAGHLIQGFFASLDYESTGTIGDTLIEEQRSAPLVLQASSGNGQTPSLPSFTSVSSSSTSDRTA